MSHCLQASHTAQEIYVATTMEDHTWWQRIDGGGEEGKEETEGGGKEEEREGGKGREKGLEQNRAHLMKFCLQA